jgi:fatty-acyl-CoA synthase
LEQEQVTIAAGVPTVWNVLYQQIKKKSYNLKLHTMVVGGSAAPRSMKPSSDGWCAYYSRN